MFVMEMNSNAKGAVAEQAIVLAATKLRIPVWRPVADHGRADLVLEIGGELLRVQVKWGHLSPAQDLVMVRLSASRRTARGHIRTTYSEDEVELFAVYCGELDRCFLLPGWLLARKTYIRLRLTPPRNGQQACINLADDFEFDGAVAQLARARDWQSRGRGFESPQLHSSNHRPAGVMVACDQFRTRFGYWIERVAAGEDAVVTRRGKPLIRLSAVAPASTPASGPAPDLALGPAPAPAIAPASPRLPGAPPAALVRATTSEGAE